jgi:hypothetical protein
MPFVGKRDYLITGIWMLATDSKTPLHSRKPAKKGLRAKRRNARSKHEANLQQLCERARSTASCLFLFFNLKS